MAQQLWFRLYSRTIDDGKLKLLAFEDRWHFIAILCLKSQGIQNNSDYDLIHRMAAAQMGLSASELDEVKRRLMSVGLIDENLDPVAWNDLQFKSDLSTDRVKKHREKQQAAHGNKVKRSRNVSETHQSRTEQSRNRAETEKKTPSSKEVVLYPDWLDQEAWMDWALHRKEIKKPMTPLAEQKGMNKLRGMLNGVTQRQIIDHCIANGYQGLFAPDRIAVSSKTSSFLENLKNA